MLELVFFIDLKGNFELVNLVVCEFFFFNEEKVCYKIVGSLLGGYNFVCWFDGGEIVFYIECVLIDNQDYLMEIILIQFEDENQQSQMVGVVVMLKLIVCMGKQL